MNDDNLRIWSAVEKTDPRDTKAARGNQGSFTAIDGYKQLRNATALFGPAGDGWWWHVQQLFCQVDPVPDNPPTWVAVVRIYHSDKPDRGFDAVGGALAWLRGRGGSWKGVDHDAPKKAVTDAITKGLSYLGFNADVFLGKFDDNKYVQERNDEVHREEAQATEKTRGELLIKFQQRITDAPSKKALRAIMVELKDAYGALGDDNAKVLRELAITKGKDAELPEDAP